MKKYLFKHLALIIAITFCITKSQAQSLPITSYGVWDRGGGIPDYSAPNADFVKGIETTLDWKDIQAGPGTNCDFSAFQTILDVAVANDKLIRFSINAGPDCPLWVFDNGVPLVNVISNAPKNDAYANRNPYYPDPEYKAYYFEMIRQFALFLRNQPQEKFEHIAFVQVKTGATGDEEPYKGDVINPIYDLTLAQWEAFRLEAFAKFKENFNDPTNRKIVLTFNSVDPDKFPDAYNFVMNQLDPVLGFGIKGGAFNRGHHLSEEQSYKEQWNPFLINPKIGPGNLNGVKLFSASEMDQSWEKGYFALNYEIGFYWSALGGINTGLSCTNVSVSAMTYALANPGIIDIFKMYNRYAKQVYPATATTAFSVFHEGLNSEDTVKFPVSTYGTASKTNLARYQAICNDPKYANRGARIDDPIAVVKGQVFQREDQEFYNDAGWDICEGNIERFMTQINPDAYSIGLFRVRGPLTSTSSKYDRFARSFENSTGKNTMYFQLHTELPVNNKTLRFTIIWLDKTAGSTWAFKYRNAAGLQAIPFTGTGTNQWRTETITLSDAIINQGGTLQSDFMLANTDTTDDIFNGIEMNIIQDQTINFNALPSKKVGDANFSPGATASSGLAVTYTSSNTNVATIVGNNIQIVGSGSCTITASQVGDNYYHPASSVSQYLAVAVETKTTITTTGTWTAPAGINKIKVEACGGGGGGGGTSLAGFAGGGAGGSYVINDSVTVVPATSYNVTVGAGAGQSASGTGANGYNGSNTTFGSTTPVIANGGVGGSGTNTAGQLGAGGTNSSGGSGGTVAIGLPGASGTSGSGGAGGDGAGDLGGSGGGSKTSAGNGISGTSPGGGGGGAYGNSGTNRGAAGGTGRIIITYSVGTPDAPTIGTATVSGVSGQASIPFTAPVFNGNATITSYTATSSPGGITGTLSQAGSGTIIMNGLTTGTAYTFTVRATNSRGQSAESAASNAVTPFTVPDAPTIGTAELTGINGQATISFTAPAYNGGSPITSYVATSSPGGITGTLSQAGSGTITVNGLSDGNSYTFTVKAANLAGLSAASGTSNAVLPEYRTPQTITFGTLSAVNYGDAVLPGATASSGLPVTYSSSNTLVATTSGSTITVVGTGSATITASQGGNVEYAVAQPVSQTLVVNKKTLSITTPSIASKIYNSLPASGVVTPGTLSGFVGTETVTATATGLYTNANVGSAKSATITYTLADGTNGGKAANYSLASGTAVGAITQAPLTVTGVVANNKAQDGNTTATLSALGSLSGVFAADIANVTLNSSSVSANFDTATAGVAIPITISGYSISGSASANYSLSQPTGITANIAPPATITAEGATTFCSGGSVTLSANTGSGLTYSWSPGGATTSSITANTQGSYTVTVTGIGGSTASAATTVTVNPSTTQTTPVTAYKTYTWSAGNGNTYTVPGNYTHVVGCHTKTLALTFTSIPSNGSSDLTFCKGATIATAKGSTSLQFYTAFSGGAPLTSTTALTSKIYYLTETKDGEESSREGRAIVVNNLPATPGTMTTTDAVLCKHIGTSNQVTYTVPAVASTTYNWTATAGINIVPDASATDNSITVNFLNAPTLNVATGGIGTISVKSVSLGCESAASKALVLTAKVPTAPTSLIMTSTDETAHFKGLVSAADPLTVPATPAVYGLVGLNTLTAGIKKVGPYMKTNTEFILTAPEAPTAASYLWTLNGATQLTGGNGRIITVKFNDNALGTIGNLAISVQSEGGCGNSTLRTLTLARAIPSAPTKLVLTSSSTTPNLSSLLAISKVGPYTGTDIAFTLTATPFTTQGATATSYAWILPTGVTCETAHTEKTVYQNVNVGSVEVPNIVYSPFTAIETASNEITVKFGNATKGTGNLDLLVFGLNGSGNSLARKLTLSRALPTAPTALVLRDGATVVTKVGPYTAKETSLTLTATPFTTQGAEATSFSWVLPAGVNVTAGVDAALLITPPATVGTTKTWTGTSSVLTINLNGISGASTSMTSIPLSVYAVNGAGTSAARTLTVTATAPSTPGSITPPTSTAAPTYNPTCNSGIITVQVPNVNGVSYAWTVGAGASITGGQGTNSITINVVNVTTATLAISVVGSNGTGNSGTRALTIKKVSTCRAAAESIADNFSVTAYPNPSSGVFNINVQSSDKGVTGVQVYDMAGRLIESRQAKSNSVEVGRNYASGVYNVKVNKGAQVKTLRVIKR